MTLQYKPDFDEAATRWRHFWNGDIWKRPPVLASVSRGLRDKSASVSGERYYRACTGQWDEQLRLIDESMQDTIFLGESMPQFGPDHGPDQWAAFFGATLKFSEDSKATNWVDPIVDDWESVLPLKLDPDNPTFRSVLDYAARIAEHGEGRYLVSQIDHHSNADTLSALRGPQNFCMDLFDCPDLLERAMQDVRKAYAPVIEAIYEAGRMGGERGCTRGFWHERSFAIVQSDVICMLSPDDFKRFVLPALEEEVALHDSTYFHLDGEGALRHLDDILAIEKLGVLQWVPGAGKAPNFEWLDVLKRAQAAGKAVVVYGGSRPLDFEAVKALHRELDPSKVVYSPSVKDEAEFYELTSWLEKNT